MLQPLIEAIQILALFAGPGGAIAATRLGYFDRFEFFLIAMNLNGNGRQQAS